MTRQDTPNGGTRLPLINSFEQADTLRHERIRKDISKRLRNACSHLPDEDFAALVETMVGHQLKSEGRSP